MFSQAFSLAVWESLFPACVVRGRANLLLSFHSAAPIPLQSLSVFSLLLAVAGQQEEAPSLFHISSPLKYPLDVVLPFSYIRGRFVYCPFFLVQFIPWQAAFYKAPPSRPPGRSQNLLCRPGSPAFPHLGPPGVRPPASVPRALRARCLPPAGARHSILSSSP